MPAALTQHDMRSRITKLVTFQENLATSSVPFDDTVSSLPVELAARIATLPLKVVNSATDGSGGEHSADRRARSCGWAVCWLTGGARVEVVAGLAGTLPLANQTVPLAELYAFLSSS